MTAPAFLDVLEELITTVVEPAAADVDANGTFPRAGITALGQHGLLGLLSAPEVGGMGLGLAEAAQVVRRLASACGSTAMVVCMHYCATAVVEQHGPDDTRRAIAAGSHLSTLAFSETGSRSQFWAPLGTARADGGDVVLNASKSWVTSAGEADSYVWTSQPLAADAGASLWLVPANAGGLKVGARFDGLGLRGNASSPVSATDVVVSRVGRPRQRRRRTRHRAGRGAARLPDPQLVVQPRADGCRHRRRDRPRHDGAPRAPRPGPGRPAGRAPARRPR